MDLEQSNFSRNVAGNPRADAQPAAHLELAATAPGELKVIRRNGKVTVFDADKIKVAITKAFLAVEGGNAAASTRIHETVEGLTHSVVRAITRRMPASGAVHIEDIQDQVELGLMRAGEHKIARSYVLYREERARERHKKQELTEAPPQRAGLSVTRRDGTRVLLDENRLRRTVGEACQDLANTDPGAILEEAMRSLFDGVAEDDVSKALIMSARTFIEREPNYSYVGARLLLDAFRQEALLFTGSHTAVATQREMGERYPYYFESYVKRAIDLELMDPRLGNFDLKRLGSAIDASRDFKFNYLGLQTLYDRYFLQHQGTRFELPQAFFMRVAMGLAINEIEPEPWAIKFYNLLSTF